MFLKMRSTMLLTVAASLCGIAAQAQTTYGPVKVAVLNSQRAVADTIELKKVQAQFAAKFRPTETQMQTLQQDLQSIQSQLTDSKITPDREAQLRAKGTLEQRQLQRLNEDLQADENRARQDILTRAGRQMTEVVRKIAEARGLDVVIDISNTLYFKPALDITAEATAAYDKAYPAQ